MSLRPRLANICLGLTTHGQLVSGISSPSTGPATASTAEFGRTDERSSTAAWIASSMVLKLAVWTICGSPASEFASSTIEKRALVPPMSPIRIGNRNDVSSSPAPGMLSSVPAPSDGVIAVLHR